MTKTTESDRRFNHLDMLAGLQIMDWALMRMYLYGAAGQSKSKRRQRAADLEVRQAMELIRLVKKSGHHRFRDQIAGLAPAHAEGQRLGQEAAGITNYKRSHDLVWTECFMGLCCDLSGPRLALKPDWRETAITVWTNIGEEIAAGVAPDFERPEQTRQGLGSPPED
jgi:hypothetical protein